MGKTQEKTWEKHRKNEHVVAATYGQVAKQLMQKTTW